MPINSDSLNKRLYNLLKTQGLNPIPKDSEGDTTPVPDEAEVIKFTIDKNGKPESVWATIDGNRKLTLYYDDNVMNEDSEDHESWENLRNMLKSWAMRKGQLSFELKNKNHLASDMAQRSHMKKKEQIAENAKWRRGFSASGHPPGYEHKNGEVGPLGGTYTIQRQYDDEKKVPVDKYRDQPDQLAGREKTKLSATGKPLQPKNAQKNLKHAISQAKGKHGPVGHLPENIAEGYYPMGKSASYNDNVPTVKIVLQHTRQIQEGEQRYRNVARIFLENQQGERILCPSTKPGIAQIYARHLAEGGLPHDDRWNHIGSLVEEYSKMAGFVRATRKGQFNESAQKLVNEGVNHYNSLRETLGKMRGHRGYQSYFESYTPNLMETEGDETINELFVQETLDPRIESVMPILAKLHKKVNEMNEVKELAEWADGLTEEESLTSNNPQGIPEEKITESELLGTPMMSTVIGGEKLIWYRKKGDNYIVYGTFPIASNIPPAKAKEAFCRIADEIKTHKSLSAVQGVAEGSLEEVSKKMLGRYISKARDDLGSAISHSYRDYEDDEADEKDNNRAEKRQSGIDLARAKINKSGKSGKTTAKVKATEGVAEGSLNEFAINDNGIGPFKLYKAGHTSWWKVGTFKYFDDAKEEMADQIKLDAEDGRSFYYKIEDITGEQVSRYDPDGEGLEEGSNNNEITDQQVKDAYEERHKAFATNAPNKYQLADRASMLANKYAQQQSKKNNGHGFDPITGSSIRPEDVAEAKSPEEFVRGLAGQRSAYKKGDWVTIRMPGYASDGLTGKIVDIYRDSDGEKKAKVAVGGASGIQKKMRLHGEVLGPAGSEFDLGKGIRTGGTHTEVPLDALELYNAKTEQGVAEGRFIKGPGGVPLDRHGNPKVAKPKMPKISSMFEPEDDNEPEVNLDAVWRKVEDVVGQIYPDGDPIDWLGPWFRKQGIQSFKIGDILEKAAQKNGYKDIYDYWDSFGKDSGYVAEMDSQGYKGHRGDEDPGKGPEKVVKPAKTKKVAKDAEKTLNKAMDDAHKKDVKEGQEDLEAILRIVRK